MGSDSDEEESEAETKDTDLPQGMRRKKRQSPRSPLDRRTRRASLPQEGADAASITDAVNEAAAPEGEHQKGWLHALEIEVPCVRYRLELRWCCYLQMFSQC